MQIQQLRYFVAVAEAGSLSAAAEKLFVSQPNLSKTVVSIESQYGTKMFKRTARGMLLTDEGNLFYQNAKKIISQMDELEHNLKMISASENERLVVASYTLPIVEYAIAHFYINSRDVYTGISIEYQDMSSEAVLDAVASMDADIGFLFNFDYQRGILAKLLKHHDLSYEEITRSRNFMAVGEQHPLYGRRSATLAEVIKYPLIRVRKKNMMFPMSSIEKGELDLDLFKSQIFVSTYYAVDEILHNTDALIVYPDWEPELLKGRIHLIEVEDIRSDLVLGFVKKRKLELSSPALELVGEVRRVCGEVRKTYKVAD